VSDVQRSLDLLQVSAVADESVRCTASQQTCCKQRWTFSAINLRPTLGMV